MEEIGWREQGFEPSWRKGEEILVGRSQVPKHPAGPREAPETRFITKKGDMFI